MKHLGILLLAFFVAFGAFATIDTLAIQDFETVPQTPTLSFVGPVVFNNLGLSSASAAPANSPTGIAQSRSWETTQVSSGIELEFANVSVSSGYDSVTVEFRLAGMNLNSSSGGPDHLDFVLVEVSTDGGTNYYNRLRIRGSASNNSFWPFSASGLASVHYLPQTEAVFQPNTSGLQIANGYSTGIIRFPGNIGQLRVRITARSSSASDTWLIDDLLVLGHSSCPVQADFGPANLESCIDDTVHFNNNSIGASSYSWSINGVSQSTQTNFSQSFATPGLRDVTLTASNGTCSDSKTRNLEVHADPQLVFAPTPPNCPGEANGSVLATVAASNPAYTYSWSTGTTDSLLTNVPAANYSVTVTDASACSTSDTISLNDPPEMVSELTGFEPTCNGADDGSLLASIVSGGNGPFFYSWSNGSTTGSIAQLLAGTYAVTITDISSCTATDQYVLNEPSSVSALVSSTPTSSGATCDGSITVTINGGTLPYSYLWNDPMIQTGATAFNLCPGMYSVSVNDSNDCLLEAGPFAVIPPVDPTGIEEMQAAQHRAYPNPANDIIFINLNHPTESTTLTLFSTTGQVVWEGSATQNTSINTASLPAGTYLLQILNNGKSSWERIQILHR